MTGWRARLGFLVPAGTPEEAVRKLFAATNKIWTAPDRERRQHQLIGVITEGRTESSTELTDTEWRDLFDATDLLALGSIELAQDSHGKWALKAKPQRQAPPVPKAGGK